MSTERTSSVNGCFHLDHPAQVVAGVLLAAMACVHHANANPGDLDPGFGSAGLVTTDFTGTEDQAGGLALQSDGRIVLAGSTLIANSFGAKDFAVARYLRNGTPDQTFGTGGKVTSHLPSSFFNIATSVLVQPDGRIVIGGYSDSGLLGNDLGFALVRYLADGSLDASFGNAGVVLTNPTATYTDAILSLALQTDGKIVAAGLSYSGSMFKDPSSFAVARYDANGTPDSTFGSGGVAQTAFDGDVSNGLTVAIDSTGRIVVGGTVYSLANGGWVFGLARYTPAGVLDSQFGSAGKVMTGFTGAGYFHSDMTAMALQPDGRIVAAGRAAESTGYNEFLVARYAMNGSLDASFGNSGLVPLRFGDDDCEAHAIAIDSHGAILIGGHASAIGYLFTNGGEVVVSPSAAAAPFALARLLPDGTPDARFGINGSLVTRFSNDDALGDTIAAIKADAGGILVAGFARTWTQGMSTYASNADFAMARYDDGYSIFSNGFEIP